MYRYDIVYASDIPSYILYADDSNMFHSDHNITKLVNEMNNELRKIAEWFKANQLIVNMDKTHFVIFSRKRILENISIYLNDIKLKEKIPQNS